uniref:zinc finger protein RFP-like n=1 Tax=Euleptes europaea TaxID=460621 RepID=UPI00254146BB|nr:zinc finger protein RFP-like [Euleptes europaea]
MAAGSPLKGLCDEITCPICLEYFTDPVVLDCGHSFCQECITRCWGESETEATCPQCREAAPQRNFRPNQQLASLLEIIKKAAKGERAEGRMGVCKLHEGPLKLFCKDDQAPICLVCEKAKEHRTHRVVLAEEAAEEYKEKIVAQMKSLEKEREILIGHKLAEEQRSKRCRFEEEKLKIQAAFSQMYRFLKDKERFILSELGDLEQEINKRQEGNDNRLSEKISHLSEVIAEMEGKCQQPPAEFLQDIRNTMSRLDKKQARHTAELFPSLEDKLQIYTQKKSALEKTMKGCKESLEKAMNKVYVTLDPDTAHPMLILSQGLKCVSLGDRRQDLPDMPGRFDTVPCVLGCEGFTSGRHWWEVEVKTKVEVEGSRQWTLWDVGVARNSARRKGHINCSVDEGVWALGKPHHSQGPPCQLWASTSASFITVTVKREPRKIRVSLDYEEGRVAFFDADTNVLLFAFPSVSFSGKMIRPFFWLAGNISQDRNTPLPVSRIGPASGWRLGPGHLLQLGIGGFLCK